MASYTLTIGRRIALGFFLVFAVVCVLSGIAWLALGSAGNHLRDYASSTQETSQAASLTSQMLALKLSVNEFLADSHPERVAEYARTKKILQDQLKAATTATADPGRTTLLTEAQGMLEAYDKAFTEVVARTSQLASVVQNEFNASGIKIDESLQTLLAGARNSGDMNAAFRVSNALKAYFQSHGAANAFLLSSRPEEANGARESLKIVSETLAKMQKDYAETIKMDESMKDAAHDAALKLLEESCARYTRALEELISVKQQRDTIVAGQLNVLAPKFTSSLAAVQASVTSYQEALSNDIRQRQDQDETRVFSTTVGGLLLGLAIAYFIIRSISRPIQKIATALESESQLTLNAARQVASVSEAIASGASRQAASLEESSASLHEITSMTQQNSQGAHDAKNLAAQARATADAGTQDMAAMRQAMEAIQQSSGEISKIIKTIDEIAFQTNLLALNAAVEAARAGEAGAGFAVVADEVRSLAQRSAHAAHETSEKIAAALEKSRLGTEISGKVTNSLSAIVEKIRQLDERMGAIANASVEQTNGLQQVSQAVTAMDDNTQANAALAEEAASSAAQLQSQATEVQAAVGQLMVMVRGASTSAAPVETVVPQNQLVKPVLPSARKKPGQKSKVDPKFAEMGASFVEN